MKKKAKLKLFNKIKIKFLNFILKIDLINYQRQHLHLVLVNQEEILI